MKKFFTLLCAVALGAYTYAQDVYDPSTHTAVVSGSEELCSGNWSQSDAMTYVEADGKWEITLGASVANKTLEFKVVYDSEWYGNSDGSNVQFSVTEVSDVLITFDPQTYDITVTGDKVAGAVSTIDFICATGSTALFGASWDVTGDYGKMTQEDDNYYTYTVTNVEAGTHEFKFAANGGWAIQWGADKTSALENGVQVVATTTNGGNFNITLPKGATYNVTLTLDLMSDIPYVTATWEEAGKAEVKDDVYSVVGTFNGWGVDDTTTEMTNDNGVYSVTIPMSAGDHQLKVVLNHSWTTSYGGYAAGLESDNYYFTLANDADVTVTLDTTKDQTTEYAQMLTVTYPLSDGIQSTEAAETRSVIYNLAGQRVNKATKGLYIINGKKVLR